MPTTDWSGTTLHYALEGPDDRPVVAFVGDVGYGPWLWSWQQPGLVGPYRTLVWDLPGTGRSEPPPADLDVSDLAAALEAVLGDAACPRVHLIGAGLGGAVALRYAREYGRARSLVLLGSTADGDAVDRTALEALGMDPDDPETCRPSLAGAVTEDFRTAAPDVIDRICDWRVAEDAGPEARSAHARALCSFEAGPLYELELPALVLHGVADPVVPTRAGRALAEDLPRGTVEPVEGRHLAFVEHARAVTDRIAAFLDDHAGDR